MYLLTYTSEKEATTFAWFTSEIELREFVEEHKVTVIDAMLIKDYEDLE
jgi:hypothetical protein